MIALVDIIIAQKLENIFSHRFSLINDSSDPSLKNVNWYHQYTIYFHIILLSILFVLCV